MNKIKTLISILMASVPILAMEANNPQDNDFHEKKLDKYDVRKNSFLKKSIANNPLYENNKALGKIQNT